MNRPKPSKAGGRDEPIEDPELLREAITSLFESEVEFPIKVEGTSTLPYASRVQQVIPESREIILKLVRPLPHELMAGALFQIVFAVGDQRYEALITYKQREAYLQYRFSQPERLVHADRRRHKRYPFRPRESAYVTASDGGIPGTGIAGPLANIGMGGLCLRVDRVLRLDTGLRIPPGTALFDRGTSYPRIRLQDLPRLPVLEVHGWVAHAEQHGSEVLLGFDFGELTEDQARSLGDCLAFREKMFQSKPGGGISDSGGISRREVASRATGPLEAPEDQGLDPSLALLRLLRRKTARLALVCADPASAEKCRQALWRCGYQHLDTAGSCEEAAALWRDSSQPVPRLVLLDLLSALTGDQEPLAAVRHLEKERVLLGEVPTAILCEDIDPTMLLGQSEGTRFLPWGQGEEQWVSVLDGFLGFGEG
ncbi:MAG TPA: PilZ domain-containing protein [Holophaga sp.]|nr:PilZ domain-containing protein [Holophaga sp.]